MEGGLMDDRAAFCLSSGVAEDEVGDKVGDKVERTMCGGQCGEAVKGLMEGLGVVGSPAPPEADASSPSPPPPSLGASARPRRNEVKAGNGERAGVRGEAVRLI